MSYEIVNPNSDQFLWEHSNGLGDYKKSGDWSWEFYPYPYDFLAPLDSAAQPAPIISGFSGLGCGSCSGSCSSCKKGVAGLGQGLFNTGLFTSSDPTTWGVGEWVAVAAGLYVAGSLFGDARSAGRKAGAGYRAARKA